MAHDPSPESVAAAPGPTSVVVSSSSRRTWISSVSESLAAKRRNETALPSALIAGSATSGMRHASRRR
jgi:hypothetical protein